mgnify:CR=1 FL=1
MRKTVLTILFAALLPLGLMAQITEPGATEPNQLYTTTYDNPGGPNRAGANGGPNRIGENWGGVVGSDGLEGDPDSPVGAPWALLAFAAAYGAFRLIRRRG